MSEVCKMDDYRIAALKLSPDDTLVVKADRIISYEMAAKVKKEVVEATGHQKVMVIDSTVDISVLTACASPLPSSPSS